MLLRAARARHLRRRCLIVPSTPAPTTFAALSNTSFLFSRRRWPSRRKIPLRCYYEEIIVCSISCCGTFTRPQEDDWTLPIAAGTCLALIANTVMDEVVPEVMPFVRQHLNNPDWRFREVLLLSFFLFLFFLSLFIATMMT